jgi:EXS family
VDDAALPVERSWIVQTIVLPACMVSPLRWRFNQNLHQVWDAKKRWPYLGNALKYLAAAEVAMFAVFNPAQRMSSVWLVCAISATFYQVWWDVVMDWDELIQLERQANFTMLRLKEQRLDESKWQYWTILVVNIILRFGWIRLDQDIASYQSGFWIGLVC